MKLKQLFPYDIETYPNVFTMVIGNMQSRKMKTFEISSRKDERDAMFKYLNVIKNSKSYMVGFNNEYFDYPVIHYILKNKNCSVKDIYNKAQSIIDSEDRFANTIWQNDVLINQIDLFKIHHFDNKARSTSLKMLEFIMRMDDIQELPYSPGSILTDSEIDNLIKYNKHDLKATALFLEKSLKEIEFREDLSEKQDKYMMNFNDTKIGKDYFVSSLEKSNPGCCYKKVKGKKKPRQTIRNNIDLSTCIFPYVKFKRKEFNAILDWIKKQNISETKGVFTDILESDLGEVAEYANLKTKRQKKPTKPGEKKINEYKQKHPSGWLSEEPLKSGKFSYWWNWNVADALNVVVDDLEYVFGTGGIHASVESQTITSNDDYVIIDQDVSSYYPNLAIKNRIYPEHLGETFCDLYEDMYNQRKRHKKGTIENAMLKLALNGSYGASNDKYSPLYDPKFTMMITINGQLSLCMLAESLLEIDDLKIIQCNTDGLTYYCKRSDVDKAQSICDEWCNVTKLELEKAVYSKMAIRDVNNYIAVYENGDVKCKGAYQYENLDWAKNHSAIIISMAAVENIVNGVDVDTFIRNYKNIYDFMFRTKIPRSSRLVSVDEWGIETEQQRISRYYISNDGYNLVKIMPPLDKVIIETTYKNPDTGEKLITTKKPTRKGFTEVVSTKELPPEKRRTNLNSQEKVKICNNIKDFDGDINYEYYINESKKLVDSVSNIC